MKMLLSKIAVAALGATMTTAASADSTSAWIAEWSKRGDIKIQAQAFTDNASHSADQSFNLSLSGNAEFNKDIGDNGTITISPFFRIDQNDDARTHFDFREFIYSHSGDSWEVNVGLGKVFWGVAESSNIVDIINQKDAVEGISPEHKLGQPMINLLLLKDWGEISFFILPGFRERTYASEDGRPRGLVVFDTDNPVYESSNENNHIDVAARVSGAIDAWDLGLHIFHGTTREPSFNIPSLSPVYNQMTQVGADVQATLESWLYKSEFVYKSGPRFTDHFQMVSGFEYSFYDVAEAGVDIGVIAEVLYDDRGNDADTIFQNDVLLGLRFALNDEQSTELLTGVITDLDHGANTFSLEASRRIGDSFKVTMEALVWANTEDDPILNQFAQEDYVQLELGYFF